VVCNIAFMKKLFLFALIIFCCGKISAQQYEDYGFQPDLTVKVKDSLLNYLSDPWGGGLNSCQFSEIDLNLDGIMDLVVFDQSGSKIIPFINNGTANTVDYTYAPQYRDRFPAMHDWMEFVDYNCDGKNDIFTSSNGGITVYKNISDLANGLRFQLVTNNIMAMQDTQDIPIYVSTVNYPAIADIDNDGDLDILNDFILGTYVYYYKNQSMELYGNCDSLNFVLTDHCWGKFAISSSNNQITLNTTCLWKADDNYEAGNIPVPKDIEHIGSTLMAADMNGDGLKDLLAGDVSYPGLIKLTNGGTLTDALMISQDTMFPSNSLRVSLFSFPAPFMLDVNNDGVKDLIVSPFDGNQTISENLKSCWYYKNDGTTTSPVFNYQYDNFLQKDMIETGSGAYPVLADFNGDGLPDLFIGNFGVHDSSYYSGGFLYSTFKSRIALYKNIGTATNPEFQFVTNDFANVGYRKLNGIIPTFGDIDGDSAQEMIIGKSDGTLDLYENTSSAGQPMNMVLAQTNYQSINVGKFAAPQLVDLDGDSLLDLVIGERNGNLNYYRNTGTKTNPIFTPVTDTLGWVDVIKHQTSNYGYSVPCFFKDSTNHFRLFLGSESGNIYYYKNIDGNINGHFTLQDSMFLNIYEGSRTGIAIGNLNGDNYPDMIMGNYSGGVSYYKGVTPPPLGIYEYSHTEMINPEVFPNPANDMLYIKLSDKIPAENMCLKVYNMMGQLIPCNINLSKEKISIDVSSLNEGLYFFCLSGKDGKAGKGITGTGKFIVLHYN